MKLIKLVGVAAVTVWAGLLSMPAPSASAEPCPDVEVIFARGTGEPPGVGGVGQAFVDALRSQAGGKSRRRCIRSTTPPAATSPTRWRSLRPSSKASGTRALISSQRRRTAPRPEWCWAATRKARRSRAIVTSAAVPPGVPAAARTGSDAARGGRPRRRGRSLRQAVGRVDGSVRRAADRDRPGLCGEDRSSCALPATRSATARPVGGRPSRTRCIR